MATTTANTVETDKPLHESFDNGIGVFTDNWNVDATVPGQVTLRGTSGLMQQATSTSSGQGYGTYTITAKLEGNMPGPAIILWPGDNHWPGQEINLAEVTNDGTGRIYGALHWDDNGDHAVTQIYSGITTGVFHDFTLVWAPDHMTYLVDGVQQWEVTQYVPKDFDNGGMNNVIGWLNTNYDTSMTVTQVDYVPLGVTGTAPVVEAPTTPGTTTPVTTTPTAPAAIDWEALAAQAAANYAATGHWYYDDPSAPATTTPVTTPPVTTTPPVETTAPGTTPPATTTPTAPAAIDWGALAAQAEANYAATGHWYYDMPSATGTGTTGTTTPEPTPAAETPIDWDALAAQAAANYAATGHWFY
ncbi:MAG: glycosyl hydrolase family protein [Alphaproteobacteria bacterium]|nr:MAG: glycosyl hydrolase family protein [Alphaproteobacteria bacterium]